MDLLTWIFLAFASGFAGFVDAVAGGGGLVQLPALMIAIGDKPIPTILGTNKVPAAFGTSFATANYVKRVKPDLHVALAMAIPAFLGAMGGAHLTTFFPKNLFRPFLIVLLVAVAIYTWRKKSLGVEENLRFPPKQARLIAGLFGALIGFYDGIFGPGTGSFLLFALVTVIGYAFLKASATAKIVNLSTNIAAIITFQLSGNIWWHVGLILAGANITGAIIGSRMAIRGGSAFVRKVFLAVTFLLIARVGYDWVVSFLK